MAEKRIGIDPEGAVTPIRRHTDAPRPVKSMKLPIISGSRPRTKSWNWISDSADCSLAVARGVVKADRSRLEDFVRNARGNRDIHNFLRKRTDTSERKCKSTTRMRTVSPKLVSPQNKSFQGRRASAERKSGCEEKRRGPAAISRSKLVISKRCESEERSYSRISDTRCPNVLKGPSACTCYAVDLSLVRRYKEEQQSILAAVRDLGSGRELHSILRRHMQAYAPWTAEGLGECCEKEVHFA